MNKVGIHYAYWGSEWNADLCERIRKASKVGFDCLEVTPPDFMVDLDKGRMNDVKKCAEDYGVELTFCIGFPKEKDMASADAKTREEGIAYSIRMLEAIHYMGGKILSGILYSYWPCQYDTPITPEYKNDCWKRGVDSVRQVLPIAEEYGIIYAIEMVNRFEQFIVNSVEEGKQFCADIGGNRARLLLDTFHANIEERSIADAIRSAGSLLAHIHMSENNRRLPGSGSHIPWEEVFSALKEINYSGRLILEPFIAAGGPVGNDLRIWRNGESDVSLDARDRYAKESLEFVRRMLR